jgi:hypothetical protein
MAAQDESDFVQVSLCGHETSVLMIFSHLFMLLNYSTSTGKTRIFFDPRLSVKGAVITAGRNPKREKDPSDYATIGDIYTPNALPMYRVGAPVPLLLLLPSYDCVRACFVCVCYAFVGRKCERC